MKKINCIHYIRINIVDQKDKCINYKYQEDLLNRYSAINKYKIVGVFIEDPSIKKTYRSEFQKILKLLKSKNHSIDQLLITTWDRISRNGDDVFRMIDALSKLGVKVQAVEQPLDMEVPENKLMFAIYLTAPQIVKN